MKKQGMMTFWLLLFFWSHSYAISAEHLISVAIPKEQAGTSPNGGFASVEGMKIASINPGDRITIDVEFPDALEVIERPDSVSLSINGGRGSGNAAVGFEPEVSSEGSLKLVWSNGGVYGVADEGKIHGFWINLVASSTPQPNQKLNSLKASFVIPDNILTKPVSGDQSIPISNISWSNITTNPGGLSPKKKAPEWAYVVAIGSGLAFLSILLCVAVFVREPLPQFNQYLLRVVSSVAAAGVGASLPGFLELELPLWQEGMVHAGGALGMFVLVYLVNPPRLVEPSDSAS